MKSIKTVRAPKFASNLAEASGIALMLVVNSHADQMLCAFRAIIDQRAFVVTVSRAIQMTSVWAVNRLAKELMFQMHAKAIRNVNQDKYALLAPMDLEIVLIRAHQLHAV